MCASVFFVNVKKCYFENLDAKNITGNKNFWGTVKPLFSNSEIKHLYYIEWRPKIKKKWVLDSQHF